MTSWIRCCVLITALAVAPICAAAADRPGWTTIIGGPGGGEFEGRCRDGKLLVGLKWSGNKDINTVATICQSFESGHATGAPVEGASWGQPPTTGSWFAPFSAENSLLCPPDTAVETIGVGVSKANLVHKFAFACRNPNAHVYTNTDFAGPDLGETSYVQPAGCGGGAIAIGIVGKYGTLIDGLGLLCQVIAAPAPPAAPAKPLKSVRRGPGSNAPPGDPAGAWDMRNGRGDHYVLELSRNAAEISGVIRDDRGGAAAVTGKLFAGGMLDLHSSLLAASGEAVVFVKGDTFSGADKASGTPWTGTRLQGTAPAQAPVATAIDDVDMYSEPSGDSTNLGIWRKGSRATPLQSQDGWCNLKGVAGGRDAWVWGELVSGCAP